MQISFRPPGMTAKAFMLSNVFVRGLRGPVGSGKSVTCVIEVMRRINEQKPNAEGVRKSRWVITRNTGPMLRTTTLETWCAWVREDVFGPVKMAPPPFVHELRYQLPDKTWVEADVWFIALDSPEDVKKLLSLEITGAWINEAREVPKAIVDALTQRCRRYPAMSEGGPSWSGVIMDTNAPDDDHWWPIMAGEAPPPEGMSEDEVRALVRPSSWEFFCQPPAMSEVRSADGKRIERYEINAAAENIQNLHPEYYPGQIAGKTKAYIDVYILNKLGATYDGRPVQGDFSRAMHVAAEKLQPVMGPISWCADFGLTPAALAYQIVRGRMIVLMEIVLTDAGAVDLAAAINRAMTERFPGHKIGPSWGDPAGDQRAGTDKRTPFQIMRAAGIPMRPTETNDTEIRREALGSPLRTLVAGEPAILLDPSCKITIAGLEGAWCYKRVAGSGGGFEDEPQKNRYSHPCEALEYGALGGGFARHLLGRKQAAGKVHNGRATADPMKRFGEARRAPATSGWRRR